VHGSGPMWIAAPSSQWTCTTYSLPVSTGAPEFKKIGKSRCGRYFPPPLQGLPVP
jgi:hypothetical protein